MEKHAVAFRDICVGGARVDVPTESNRLLSVPLCPSVHLYGSMTAKSGMWLLCSSLQPPPDSRPRSVGRHLYATFVFDFPLQAQCDALFPATAQCTSQIGATAHTAVHIDPLALARA